MGLSLALNSNNIPRKFWLLKNFRTVSYLTFRSLFRTCARPFREEFATNGCDGAVTSAESAPQAPTQKLVRSDAGSLLAHHSV